MRILDDTTQFASIFPSPTLTRDLGSTGLRWATAFTDLVDVTSRVSIGGARVATTGTTGAGTTLVPGRLLTAWGGSGEMMLYSYLSGVTTGLGILDGASALLGPFANNCLVNWELRGGTATSSATTGASLTTPSYCYQPVFGASRTRLYSVLANSDAANPQTVTLEFLDPNTGLGVLIPHLTALNYFTPYLQFANVVANKLANIKCEYRLISTGLWTTLFDAAPTFAGVGFWRGPNIPSTFAVTGVRFTFTLAATTVDYRLMEAGFAQSIAVQGANTFGLLNGVNTWGQTQQFKSDVRFDANVGIRVNPATPLTLPLEVIGNARIYGSLTLGVITGAINFWDSSAYQIAMKAVAAGEVVGAPTSDYNLYSEMGLGTTRGFVWRNSMNAAPNLMQLHGAGDLYVSKGVQTYAPSSSRYTAGAYTQAIWKDALWYESGAASVTGALVIRFNPTGNRMMQIKVKGYWYAGNIGAFELLIGGYAWTNAGVAAWVNTSVKSTGNLPTGTTATDFKNVTFRIGGAEAVIVLGDVTTQWPWFRLVVSEIVVGHSSATLTPANSMFLTLETDLTAWPTTVFTKVLTKDFDYSAGTPNYAARWTGTNTLGIGALRDTGTQVGVGMTPAEALDVTGNIRLSGLLKLPLISAESLATNGSGHVVAGPASIVTGSGTLNYLPRFSGAKTLIDSAVYDTGFAVVSTRQLHLNFNPVLAAHLYLATPTTGTAFVRLVDQTDTTKNKWLFGMSGGTASAVGNFVFNSYSLDGLVAKQVFSLASQDDPAGQRATFNVPLYVLSQPIYAQTIKVEDRIEGEFVRLENGSVFGIDYTDPDGASEVKLLRCFNTTEEILKLNSQGWLKLACPVAGNGSLAIGKRGSPLAGHSFHLAVEASSGPAGSGSISSNTFILSASPKAGPPETGWPTGWIDLGSDRMFGFTSTEDILMSRAKISENPLPVGTDRGFFWMNAVSGTPTGTVIARGNSAAGLIYDSASHSIWANWSGTWRKVGGTAGTVTSVGLAMTGTLFTVTGSPVTGSGTLTATMATVAQNLVFAGPTSGSALPTFRGLAAADIPTLPWSKISGAGVGTLNTLPRWSATALVDSGISDNGTAITLSRSVSVAGRITTSSTDPRLILIDSDAGLNAQRHHWLMQTDQFVGRFYSDDELSSSSWLVVSHVTGSHLANNVTFTASGKPFWNTNQMPILPAAGGTTNALQRITSQGNLLGDSAVSDNATQINLGRPLLIRSGGVSSAGVPEPTSDSELVGFYREGSNTTATAYWKIATFTARVGSTYGTYGGRVEFEVHAGKYTSSERCRYRIQMGDRSSGSNPMKFHVSVEGAARDPGFGLAVYSEPGTTALNYNVYAFTVAGTTNFGSVYVNAKSVGIGGTTIGRGDVQFFPNPAPLTPGPPAAPEVEVFNTATLPASEIQWSSLGVNAPTSVFAIGGSLTAAGLSTLSGGVTIGADGTKGVNFWANYTLQYAIWMAGSTGMTQAPLAPPFPGGVDGADYNMWFRMSNAATRGFVFQNGTGTVLAQFHGLGACYFPGTVVTTGARLSGLISATSLATDASGNIIAGSGGGSVGGSGTPGRLAKFVTNTTTLTDSPLEDLGSGALVSYSDIWISRFTAKASLSLNAFSGNPAYLDFVRNNATTSKTRWRFQMQAGNEPLTLSDRAQSNLELICYDDSALNPKTALTVSRMDGSVTFGAAVTVTGTLTANSTASISLGGVVNNMLRVGPSFTGTGVSWINQPLRINGTLMLHDPTDVGPPVPDPNAHALFAVTKATGVTVTFAGGALPYFTVAGGPVSATRLISTVAQGTTPMGINSTTLVANLNADQWDSQQEANYSAAVRGGLTMIGGAVLSVTGTDVKWSARIMAIGVGAGTHFGPSGFFDIECPAAGAVITGAFGTANATVTANGIPLGSYFTLYYILPIGGSSSSVPANFRLYEFSRAGVIPPEWVMVCKRNATNVVTWFSGDRLLSGQSIDTNAGITVSISGTAGRLTKYATASTLGNSLLSESGSTVTADGALTVTGTFTAVATAVFSNATPFTVPAGAGLITNLNADLLDGQHGSYYLAWANLTGKPTGTADTLVKFTATSMGDSILKETRVANLATLRMDGAESTSVLQLNSTVAGTLTTVGIELYQNSLRRWALQTVPDSTGNIALYRANDSGALTPAFTVARSNGAVSLVGALTVGGAAQFTGATASHWMTYRLGIGTGKSAPAVELDVAGAATVSGKTTTGTLTLTDSALQDAAYLKTVGGVVTKGTAPLGSNLQLKQQFIVQLNGNSMSGTSDYILAGTLTDQIEDANTNVLVTMERSAHMRGQEAYWGGAGAQGYPHIIPISWQMLHDGSKKLYIMLGSMVPGAPTVNFTNADQVYVNVWQVVP